MPHKETSPPKIDCHRCKHYYVTWDKGFPHGCRAMKFKARILPGATVAKSSGMPCLYYKPKQQTRDNVKEWGKDRVDLVWEKKLP